MSGQVDGQTRHDACAMVEAQDRLALAARCRATMKKLPLAIVVLCGLTAATAAHAQEEPFTRRTGQAGGQVMFGAYVGQGDPNPYGFGLGAHAGYTFDFDLHLGGRFDYFFGGSDDTLVGEVSSNFLDLMFVAGYDIAAGEFFVVRPQLGLGWLWTRGEICSGTGCQDLEGDDEFNIAPGVRVLYEIAEPVYLTAELSYNNVFAERNVDGIVLGLGAGATF